MSRSRSSSSSVRSRKSNKKQQNNNKERRRSRSSEGRREDRRQDKTQNTCLFIGNLDKRCTEDQLQKVCKEFGPFEYCYIVFEPTSHHDRNRETKISRGYGFVKYQNQADSKKAVDGLNGMEIMSRKVSVEVSKRNRPRQSTPGRYLGRRRSPPRVERSYRRRSYSRSSDGEYRRRRKNSSERERKHRDRDRDREHKDSKRRDRDRSRSGEKKHRKRRQSRSNSPRK